MRTLIGLSVLSLASLSFAQAPVEDRSSGASVRPVQQTEPFTSSRVIQPAPQPAPSNQAVMDLHYEVQSLRDEVRELRGIVEEQANALRQLKQRQLDDYQDLDSRISDSAGSQVPAAASSSPSQGSRPIPSYKTSTTTPAGDNIDTFGAGAVSPASSANTASSEGEYEAYSTIYSSIKPRIQAGKVDEVVADFKLFVAKFPNGKYTANAYYWLGEIYMVQNDLENAAIAFATVKDRFPAHEKGYDAKFKLAKAYHLQADQAKSQGDEAKSNELLTQSRALLTEVAGTDSSAALLARTYLKNNF